MLFGMADGKTPVRPEESLAKMVAALKETTGRSLEEWVDVIKEKGWQKHGEIVSGIKSEFGVTHGYANQIALRSKDLIAGTGPKADSGDPVAEMFAKRPEAKAIYDVLMPKIQAFGSDVDVAPKKGYLSLRRAKQFAVLQPAAGRLDVGIQLKGTEPAGRLEASGSFNAMLTHRVRVASASEVDAELLGWLRNAYEAAK